MIRVLRSSPLVIVFWIVCLAAISIVWRLMPTNASQIALIILFGLVVGSTLLSQTELPILTTIFLSILVIHYWIVSFPGFEVLLICTAALLIPLLGMVGNKINRDLHQLESDKIFSHWLLLGLITAESVSIFSNWPVSFFNRSLLSAVVFYSIWHLLRVQHNVQEQRSYIAHFIFVGVAVILIVGIIIWANFPHLIN